MKESLSSLIHCSFLQAVIRTQDVPKYDAGMLTARSKYSVFDLQYEFSTLDLCGGKLN